MLSIRDAGEHRQRTGDRAWSSVVFHRRIRVYAEACALYTRIVIAGEPQYPFGIGSLPALSEDGHGANLPELRGLHRSEQGECLDHLLPGDGARPR